MGSKQAQALLAALISAPLAAQDNLLINPGFEQGTVGWSSQWPGGVYGGCGPFGGACYTFSFLATTTAQTVSTPETYNEFTVSFQYRLPCNNSIGGWCQNPNGPQDWLTANLNLFLGGEPVQSVPLLSLQTYQPQYETFSLTGTSTGFNAATLSFTAQDVGFWGGPYGPQIDNASLSFGSAEPPPPPPPPEPEPEPVVPVPDAVNPAPDVTPDPVQEVLQNEPEPEQEAVVEATVEEEMIVEEAVSEEDIVSDDVAAQEEVDEDQAEDANDEPLSPDQLQALSAIEASEPPTAEEVTQAVEAVAEEAQAAEAARVEQSAPDQTAASTETRRDSNVDFFQREAVEDANTFSRETVLQASAQNIASLVQAETQDAQMYGEQTTTEATGEGWYFGIVDGPTFLPAPTTGIAEREGLAEQSDTGSQETTVAQDTTSATQDVAQQIEQSPVASLAVGIDVSPAGQAQQMELLGMQGEMSAGQVIDVGDVNTGDGETMTQLAAVPAGYSAYTQARIPDNPFYQPKDIYKGRRIPDANLALYRMMQGQDQRWNEMVEDQYE